MISCITNNGSATTTGPLLTWTPSISNLVGTVDIYNCWLGLWKLVQCSSKDCHRTDGGCFYQTMLTTRFFPYKSMVPTFNFFRYRRSQHPIACTDPALLFFYRRCTSADKWHLVRYIQYIQGKRLSSKEVAQVWPSCSRLRFCFSVSSHKKSGQYHQSPGITSLGDQSARTTNLYSLQKVIL